MMKKLFFLLLFVSVVTLGFSQSTIYFDDFESYTVGSFISASENWDTWSYTTGGANDATVSSEQNHTVGGANSLKIQPNNDIIYSFGAKIDGEYDINFWYYIPAGKTGYFNIEHVFSENWAFSVEFTNGGTGTLSYNNGASQTFSFPQDAWFPISINVDIDNDEVIFNANNNMIKTWVFSTEEGGTAVSNQLDVINFYGGDAGTWQYYVDDFEFIEIVGGSLPQEITLDLTEITSTGAMKTLVITNDGELGLSYEVYPYYPVSSAKKVANNFNNNSNPKTVVLSNTSAKNIENPIPYKPSNKDVTIQHFTAAIDNALGWNTATGVDAKAIVLFDHEFINDYIGMEVSKVIIYGGSDLPSGTSSVEVYEGYENVLKGPEDLMSTQTFVPIASAGVEVTLTTPVVINGKDIWAGWSFTQPTGAYCLGMTKSVAAGGTEDATPGVNYTKTSAVWSVENDFGNFGIAAVLTGTSVPNWLSVSPSTGIINGGDLQEIEISFELTGLDFGTHECTLVVQSNDLDLDESWIELPVTLDIVNSINGVNSIGIMTFPNPAYTEFNVVSNDLISKIVITDLSGKIINTIYPASSSYTENIAGYTSGLYLVKIYSNNTETTQKLLVK